MQLDKIHTVFFIGIGGIGMSALAKYFLMQGKTVGGYDKVASPLTDELNAQGAFITLTDEVSNLPTEYINEQTLWVYTPAIPKNSVLLNNALKQQYCLKRSEALAAILDGKKVLAVAGSHGKTSTTAWLTYIIRTSGKQVCAFVGGVTKNYNSNFVCDKNPEWFIVEADEYDRSFHRLKPTGAIITSVDADHLDIYHNEAGIEDAFVDFANRVEQGGALVVSEEAFEKVGARLPNATVYGFGKTCDIHIEPSEYKDGLQYFTSNLVSGAMRFPGAVHIKNALASFTLCNKLGIDTTLALDKLEAYQGVKRRFDRIYTSDHKIYIDDYAHHPTEINSLAEGIHNLYPTEQTAILFQPHLFSRTQDFLEGFVSALSKFTEVYLLDIYPAREEPIPGITSELLVRKIGSKACLVTFDNAAAKLAQSKAKVVLSVGAGNIDRLISSIAASLKMEDCYE